MDEFLEPESVVELPRPRLWNPAAAAWWSLLLSPAFGAWLHAANWRTLGNRECARTNILYFWLVIAVIVASLSLMFVKEPTIVKLIDRAEKPLAACLFFGWYVGLGREQVQHVRSCAVSTKNGAGAFRC